MRHDYTTDGSPPAVLTSEQRATIHVLRVGIGPAARRCLWILPSSHDPDHGYIPVVITENEPGYTPLDAPVPGLSEVTPAAQPWYWGIDYAAAMSVAVEANTELGLTPADAVAIVQSSMFAAPGRGSWAAHD